jgi:GntR family transcriptional regulator of vanillate catabolism
MSIIESIVLADASMPRCRASSWKLKVGAALEGVAARLAAEEGVNEDELRPMRMCLAAIDHLLGQSMSVSVFTEYVGLNVSFHQLVLHLSPCAVMAQYLDSKLVTPFKLPEMLPAVGENLDLFRRILVLEQDEHRSIIEAIEHRCSTRAEDLLRNHWSIVERQLARDRSNRRARLSEDSDE